MKTILSALVAVGLLIIAPVPCFALMGLNPVSKEEAKELGMEVKVEGTGAKVWVTLEIKKDSKLKDFSHVTMEIGEGDKLLVGYVRMEEKKTATGRSFSFMVSRGYVDQIKLSVVTGFPSNYTANELRVKELVEAGKGAEPVAPEKEPAAKKP